MDRPAYKGRHMVSFLVALLGLAAFACCISAELTKAEGKDVRLDRNLCSMPKTPAFELGIVAILCLCITQIIGTSASTSLLWSREKNVAENRKWRPIVTLSLLMLSWITFGFAMILLGTASSMNKSQPYGKGWLDGKCYVVKRGIYGGAAFLSLVTVFCVLYLVFATKKVHLSTPPEKHTETL